MSEQATDLMTIREVAEILRADQTTVRRWIKGGALEFVELPHYGTRRQYRIRRATLDALLSTPAIQQAVRL